MATQQLSICSPVTTLPAITTVATATLTKTLGIKAIMDLAESPFFGFVAEFVPAKNGRPSSAYSTRGDS